MCCYRFPPGVGARMWEDESDCDMGLEFHSSIHPFIHSFERSSGGGSSSTGKDRVSYSQWHAQGHLDIHLVR